MISTITGSIVLSAYNKHSQVDIYSGVRFYAGRYAGIKTTTYINAPAMGVMPQEKNCAISRISRAA
jgi:hypothetical protein